MASERNCFDCGFMRPAPDARYDCGFIRGPGFASTAACLDVVSWQAALLGDGTPTADEVAAGRDCPGWQEADRA